MSLTDAQGFDGGGFLTGRLLVAMPGIGDPRFEHAVILICLHTDEHAMGVRINLPVDGMSVAGVLARLGVQGHARNPNQDVLNGGPVERERGYVLHTDDYAVEGSTMAVSEGIALTATLEVLETLTEPNTKPARSVLALGYAGWSAGQLEMEVRENVWLACDAEPDLVFDEDHDAKWHRALARIGVSAATLSSQTGRA
ncbi:MAG TPA: YqgE/AlgH family protein [Caulobacteraceae bacterium]|jgi:putative transcriptional regulator|nr:YqgE/AlgH family protein [Caulobacteraceae bacterium]